MKREAGPRIVKPPEAILQEQQLAEKKRKLLGEQAAENGGKVTKKLKEKSDSAVGAKKPAAVVATESAVETAGTAKKDTQPGNKPGSLFKKWSFLFDKGFTMTQVHY